MVMNIYYLELIFTLMIILQQQKLRKKYKDEDLIFELKRQKVLKEELDCKFTKINTSKDLDYDISSVQNFINEFKDNNKLCIYKFT